MSKSARQLRRVVMTPLQVSKINAYLAIVIAIVVMTVSSLTAASTGLRFCGW